MEGILTLATPDGDLRAYLAPPEDEGDQRSDGWPRLGFVFLRADIDHPGDGKLWSNVALEDLRAQRPLSGAYLLRWTGRGLKLEDFTQRSFRWLDGDQVDTLVEWASSGGHLYPNGYHEQRPWSAAPLGERSRLSALAGLN